MQFGGRYGFGSVSVRIRCICETALSIIRGKYSRVKIGVDENILPNYVGLARK